MLARALTTARRVAAMPSAAPARRMGGGHHHNVFEPEHYNPFGAPFAGFLFVIGGGGAVSWLAYKVSMSKWTPPAK